MLPDVVATSLMWVLSTQNVTVQQGTKFFILFHFNLNGHNGYLLYSAGLNQYKCSKILAIIIIVVVVVVTWPRGRKE